MTQPNPDGKETPQSNPQDAQPTEFERAGGEPQPSLVKEFWMFIVDNKAWWMIPIVLTLLIVGALVALSSTGAAPFIYTLF